jgi:tetratricopeptide (TPR) repeat protein
VTFEELGMYAQTLGFAYYNSPNGDFSVLKQFLSQGIPVIAKTTLKPDDDIGHYRIVKGYDDRTQEVIQDDSLQGHNLRYSYDEFSKMWNRFGNEYLVILPMDKIGVAEKILGENLDPNKAWDNAALEQRRLLESEPDNTMAHFNLSVAYYYLGKYEQSVQEFEAVQNRLPKRTLWYQIEPIEAYYELGMYDKVFELTNQIFNDQNRGFSELYLIRGNIYEKQGNREAARLEYEKAALYNKNLKEAQEALARTTLNNG